MDGGGGQVGTGDARDAKTEHVQEKDKTTVYGTPM